MANPPVTSIATPKIAAWSTHSAKVAAALNALGFPVEINITERAEGDQLTGQVLVQFSLFEPNVYVPDAKLNPMVRGWESGALATAHPMHPFLVGLRACNAYDEVQKVIHGGRLMRLEYGPGEAWTRYVPGDESPAMRMPATAAETDDLNLVCALSVLGFPVIGIRGEPGAHWFRLPQFGHPLRNAAGEWHQPDLVHLARRATPGRLDLALEQTEPHHPLIAAYNAKHVHGQLLRRLRQRHSARTIAVSPRKWTGRYAFISEGASNRVLDSIQAHLKLPAS